jgi:hypothetical protein
MVFGASRDEARVMANGVEMGRQVDVGDSASRTASYDLPRDD